MHGKARREPGYLPVSLSLRDRSVVVIGGWHVAFQKLKTIALFCRAVTIFATEVSDEIKQLGIKWHEKAFRSSLLKGAGIVYACTDDREQNRRIAREARRVGALVNVADDPSQSDFISPAVHKQGAISVAVNSGGTNDRRAIAWRDRIREVFANDTV
jgi:precorrin-2 dehydrogenase/sirohydrochlorin ferrochelatase